MGVRRPARRGGGGGARGDLPAAQAGEYPIHLLLGIETVQGGPTKFALILASLLGIGFGALLRHARRAGGPASPPAAATIDTVPNAAPVAERPRLGSLRLRHA